MDIENKHVNKSENVQGLRECEKAHRTTLNISLYLKYVTIHNFSETIYFIKVFANTCCCLWTLGGF